MSEPEYHLPYQVPDHQISRTTLLVVAIVAAVVGMGLWLLIRPDSDPVADDLAAQAEPVGADADPSDSPAEPETDEPTGTGEVQADQTPDVAEATAEGAEPGPTTVPVPVGQPGAIELRAGGLVVGAGTLLFGQSGAETIEAVTAVVGRPDSDSGLVSDAKCRGVRTRFVRWGDLELVFDEPTAGAESVFAQWFVDGISQPEGLVTAGGIGVSATLALVTVTYGVDMQVEPATRGREGAIFAVAVPEDAGVITGTSSGPDPTSLVTTLWSGDSCPRL